jgi:hypothetical protein
VTAGTLSSSNSNVREIKLGASTVTLSGAVTFTTSTNLTFDAGTSSIVVTPVNITFNGGNQTFYDVSFTSIAPVAATLSTSPTPLTACRSRHLLLLVGFKLRLLATKPSQAH